MPWTRFIGFLATLTLFLTGCLPWVGVGVFERGAAGTTSRGVLSGGGHLPKTGAHFRFYRGGDRRFGVVTLTRAIERASKQVAELSPGSVLLVGDMSQAGGGFIGGHRSHRSGRDVDFGFYVTGLYHQNADGYPLMKFDRFGIGVRDKTVHRFDTARNWALVEALITDKEIEVQWVFVSKGLKALLLEWALDNHRPLEVIEKAASILKQPGDSAPHDDHFHVRIYCPKDASGSFCVDTGPFWPWVEKPKQRASQFTDDELVTLALEDIT